MSRSSSKGFRIKTIKTEETKEEEFVERVIDRIEKEGYVVKPHPNRGLSYYDIYKGKFKLFHERPSMMIRIINYEIRFIDSFYFIDVDRNYTKELYDFIKEFEKRTKLELVEYV